MGIKINPDMVNKVKETSKTLYNKIPERPNSFWTRKRIFIGICVILVLIIIGSFGEEEKKETKQVTSNVTKPEKIEPKPINKQETPPTPTPQLSTDVNYPQISSDTLIDGIIKNSKLYDMKYMGKTVIISGKIEKILGDYIVLETPEQVGIEYNQFGIGCQFNNKDELSKVRRFDDVYIKGTYKGLVKTNIELDNCTLVEKSVVNGSNRNCSLSDEEVNTLIKIINLSDIPKTINRECMVRTFCEMLGPWKSKDWLRLETIGSQLPFYNPTYEEQRLLNRRNEFVPSNNQMRKIINDCGF